MSTWETVLMMLLVLDAVALSALILLQQGRGADIGAAFGSGGANTMFGSVGATSFMTKLTVWLAIGFFLISFGLAYTARERAETAGTLGIPTVEATEAVETDTSAEDEPPLDVLPDELTGEGDGVDSDLPEL